LIAITAGVLSGAGVASADPGHGTSSGYGSGHDGHDGRFGDHDHHATTLYTESNAVSGNTVLAYRQNSDGTTSPLGSFATDGNGTGAGLGSQGAVTLGDGQQALAAVNAGSNSVTVFSVDHDGSLNLIDSAGSGGVDPISVTIHGHWVYVLNAGDASHPGNIAGFHLVDDHLIPAPSNVQTLNAKASSPEQIGFSPDGNWLVVTEKASDTIDVFAVDGDGNVSAAVTTALTTGTGPYGFGFTPNGTAVISEAAFGGLGTYSITAAGTLNKISEVSDGQLAACWVAISADGTNVYTANAHSGTVSFYSIASDGTLTLNNPAIATSPGTPDTDMVLTGHGTQLDVLVGTQINAAAVSHSNGTLRTSTPIITGLPTGTDGLAATN
jgi:6-phosphogluconolactonase (cycloisomerase 2 family)